MEDERIIGLFWERSEDALTALREKYGGRATALAVKMLEDPRDAEECVNDAAHVLWQKMPPERPEHLWAYFSRILRNICWGRLDYRNAARRMYSCEVCLSELEGCLSTREDPEQILQSKRVGEIINTFLDRLDGTGRVIFVRRYYYYDSCEEIAKRLGMRRGAVNTRLHRLREELRKMLEKEDICV